jgi:hypothetical protein
VSGYASYALDKNIFLQIPLPTSSSDRQNRKTLVIHYKILAVPAREYHIIQIVLLPHKLDVIPHELTKDQENWLNKHSIGMISYYPPVKSGDTGVVRLPLPSSSVNTESNNYLLFRMLPAHPEGKLTNSLIEILEITIEKYD